MAYIHTTMSFTRPNTLECIATTMTTKQPAGISRQSLLPRPRTSPTSLTTPSFIPSAAATEEATTSQGAGGDIYLGPIHMWNENKRLQLVVADVAEDTITIRSLDHDRDRFDIEFALQEGTTYNSYLIFGADKTALIDASHAKFRDIYMPQLKRELAARGRTSLDYIFVSHTEPDHSGLVADVVQDFPNVTVVGSKVCLQFLSNLMHIPFTSQQVKGGDVIDLGGGHEVEFVIAPNLHWPDTMFSYDRKSRVMYTCDAFGLHYCSTDPYDTKLEPLSSHYRFYYDCLMRPNAKSVTTALRKVKDLPYTTIANGHGPLLRYNVSELVGRYQKWSEAANAIENTVCVLYAADYGFSDRLSQTLAKGITKAGVACEMIDLLSVDPQEVVETAGRSAGIVIMAPPSDNIDARAALSTLLPALKPKKQKIVVAESYGGKDEPVDSLVSSLVSAGVEPLLDPLRVKEEPTAALYQQFEEAGTDLAQAITSKDTIAKKKAAMCPDVAKALARVSGGLYIVTAANATARSAMVASWVAQASFEPLGLTIAVAKDRAIESLMQVGDNFVLNALGEGEYGPVMKHFLQRFPAGADRFEGIEWTTASNGSPIISKAIAHMECKVVSRLETGDHWVTYAEVVDGSVAAPEKRTAVHRRKVANYY